MECMRATAEKGAMAEGLFTAWSSPLERVVLRKERYLAGGDPLVPEAATPENTADLVLPASGSGFGDKLRAALVAEGQPGAERNHENG